MMLPLASLMKRSATPLVLVFAIGAIFWWALRSGQFEDMEGPAHRILMDDDDTSH